MREIACPRQSLGSGEGAESKVAFPTMEGDPVRGRHRLTPQGGLEVHTDAADDGYPDGKWSFVRCYAPD
ncbi:hypothetical protein ACGRHY_06955 [Streptomyces sp. HK10]|uniref:hypothetical protein n=1 Tax=Streptomyces sp. HK10 TaxID=3373255 RepID=UPI003748D28C